MCDDVCHEGLLGVRVKWWALMPRSLWWWESRGGRRRWPAPRHPAGCTWSWRWWRLTSSRMQVVAPGLRVGPLRGEVRRRRPDGAGRARDRPLVGPVVPRRPEAAAGLQRRRPAHGHGRWLDAEARHAVFQGAVVVAGALLVGARLPPLQRDTRGKRLQSSDKNSLSCNQSLMRSMTWATNHVPGSRQWRRPELARPPWLRLSPV